MPTEVKAKLSLAKLVEMQARAYDKIANMHRIEAEGKLLSNPELSKRHQDFTALFEQIAKDLRDLIKQAI